MKTHPERPEFPKNRLEEETGFDFLKSIFRFSDRVFELISKWF